MSIEALNDILVLRLADLLEHDLKHLLELALHRFGFFKSYQQVFVLSLEGELALVDQVGCHECLLD